MKSILISTLILLSLNAFARKSEILITLEKEELKVDLQGYYINEIINCREVEECIGYALKGRGRAPVPLYFQNGFRDELMSFFDQNQETAPGDIPLLLKVNILRYSEFVTAFKRKMTEINLTFLQEADTGYVELFTASKSMNSSNAVTTASELLARTFSFCFMQFNDRMAAGPEKRFIPEEELCLAPPVNRKWIYEPGQRPRRGIYKSFTDFRDNRPDTLHQLRIDYYDRDTVFDSLRYIRAYWKSMNSTVSGVWGVSDGRYAFISIGDYFPPLIFEEGTYYYVDYKDRMPWKYMANQMGFPLSIAYYFLRNNDLIRIYLNLPSGLVSPYKPVQSDLFYKSYLFIYYENEYSPDQDVDVICNDKSIHGLRPQSCFLDTLDFNNSEIEILIKAGDDSITRKLEAAEFSANLLMIRRNKKGRYKVYLEKNKKDSILEDLEKGEIRYHQKTVKVNE